MDSEPVYLGDGVYASYDGYQVSLWTSDGVVRSDPIFLNDETMEALADYYEKCCLDAEV